ncbi:MAG: hypothetical protein IJ555_08790 [Ruminococcus sp.]|nr:hypothetical protein [Ruminococcus sp.]
MYNIIKAQTYQMVRQNRTYYIILGGVGFMFLQLLFMAADGGVTEMSGSYFAFSAGGALPIFPCFVCLLMTVGICGGDLGDRTMNYEILSGSKRTEVFFGRVVLSVFWSFLGYLLMLSLPAAAVGLISGWGKLMTVRGFMSRLFLQLIPLFRYICIIAALTFLTLDTMAPTVIGFVIVLAEAAGSMVISEFSADSTLLSCLLTVYQGICFYDISNVGIEYIGGEDVMVVKEMLDKSTVLISSAASLGVSAAVLMAGCLIFKDKDLK